jgi:endoglucanase
MRYSLLASYGLILGAILFAPGCSRPADEEKDAFHYNRLLGRGFNFGNALEAPAEGEWGVKLEADYFEKIKEAGFQNVRIPIRWSAHAGKEAPYEIDAEFFKRINWAVEQGLSRKLLVVLNVHHYEEMDKDPAKHLPRLLALWKQIAEHYRDQSDRLLFELMNEPHDKLTDELWNDTVPQLLKAIRASNPKRMVIVGPASWNNLDHLDKLELPKDDRRLIVTFHYYSPFEFTHQEAEWVEGSKKWKGTTWKGTEKEKKALETDFARAAAWAKKNERPLYLGEFGAYQKADMDSRTAWTRAVAREAEKHNFSWSYWEFCAGFGAYDPKEKAWRQPLLRALLDKE